MNDINEAYAKAMFDAESIQQKYSGFEPEVMIVLGTGCDEVAKGIEVQYEIPYDQLTFMPVSKVDGHHMKMVFGEYAGKKVLGFRGRLHCYMGHSGIESSYPVHLANRLGAQTMIFTSAAGITPRVLEGERKPESALDLEEEELFEIQKITGREYPLELGSIAVMGSYLPNFHETSLRGAINEHMVGPRFSGAMNISSLPLTQIAHELAKQHGIGLRDGIYVPRIGPNFETPVEVSELSYLQEKHGMPVFGGMSLVPEVEAANVLDARILAFNIGTNPMFDLHSRREIVDIVQGEHGSFFDSQGRPRYTIKELEGFYGKEIVKRIPDHKSNSAIARREKTVEDLGTLIQGVISIL